MHFDSLTALCQTTSSTIKQNQKYTAKDCKQSYDASIAACMCNGLASPADSMPYVL